MLALFLALQAAAVPAPADSLPRITLADAPQRAAPLDPNCGAAVGQIDDAEWARRSGSSVFILPSVTLNTDIARQQPKGFNFVTFQPAGTQVTAQVTARYDLFTSGQKLAELTRSAAALDGAHAGELQARFGSALLTESDYYAVLADRELLRVALDRAQRAQQHLAVARARVTSGRAVQTDSLQPRLQLNPAPVGLLQQQSALRGSRLFFVRRVGPCG